MQWLVSRLWVRARTGNQPNNAKSAIAPKPPSVHMVESTWTLSTVEAGRYWTLLNINEYECVIIDWNFANNINNPRPWKLSHELKWKIIGFIPDYSSDVYAFGYNSAYSAQTVRPSPKLTHEKHILGMSTSPRNDVRSVQPRGKTLSWL